MRSTTESAPLIVSVRLGGCLYLPRISLRFNDLHGKPIAKKVARLSYLPRVLMKCYRPSRRVLPCRPGPFPLELPLQFSRIPMRVPGALAVGLRNKDASGVRALVASCSMVCFILVSGIVFLSFLIQGAGAAVTYTVYKAGRDVFTRARRACEPAWWEDLSRREDCESTFGSEFSTLEHQLRIVKPGKRIALVDAVADKQLNSLRTRHPC